VNTPYNMAKELMLLDKYQNWTERYSKDQLEEIWNFIQDNIDNFSTFDTEIPELENKIDELEDLVEYYSEQETYWEDKYYDECRQHEETKEVLEITNSYLDIIKDILDNQTFNSDEKLDTILSTLDKLEGAL
jgi:hypothetical protein